MTDYYFENDPLEAVYADLTAHKNPTHFDRVLRLKGKAQAVFCTASCTDFTGAKKIMPGYAKTHIRHVGNELRQ